MRGAPALWSVIILAGACGDYSEYGARRPEVADGAVGSDGAGPRTDAAASAGAAGTASASGGLDAATTTLGIDAGAVLDAAPPECGLVRTASDVLINFDCAEVLDLFEFFTPPLAAGTGVWAWVPPPNPHLFVAGNVVWVTEGTANFGTQAIYRAEEVVDGAISVRFWTEDDDNLFLLGRYQDARHHYRFLIGPAGWSVSRIEDTTRTYLDSGTATLDLNDSTMVYAFEFRGDTLRAYIGGSLVSEVTDTTFPAGRVAVESFSLSYTHVDDVRITHL